MTARPPERHGNVTNPCIPQVQAGIHYRPPERADVLEEGGATNMSNKTLRWLLVLALGLAASFGSVAHADIENDAGATNVQEGDNETDTEQEGDASSGDAVAGSVV